jgi:hypothetical protein
LRGVCGAHDATRSPAAGRHGGAAPRSVEAAAPPAHAGASLGGSLEHPPPASGHADPPTPAPQQHGRPQPPAERLAAAEWAALEQLRAVDGYATRWPVGRAVTRALVKRQLVAVTSDCVLLTEAGRRALAMPPPAGDHRPHP